MKAIALLSLLTLAACSSAPPVGNTNSTGATSSITQETPPTPPRPSQTEIAGPKGSKIKGTMSFTAEGAGIHVVGEFSGLKPKSVHGLHVHENGKCDGPKFESAGGHFNPASMDHGASDSKIRHAGDLGNIKADKRGVARLDINIPMNPLNDTFGGKSVILHAKSDDLHTNPSGQSGDRVACGLIVTKE